MPNILHDLRFSKYPISNFSLIEEKEFIQFGKRKKRDSPGYYDQYFPSLFDEYDCGTAHYDENGWFVGDISCKDLIHPCDRLPWALSISYDMPASQPHKGVRIASLGLQQEEMEKSDVYKSASDALKTRICYVSQVVIFLIALVGLTIGLTVGYNEKEGVI